VNGEESIGLALSVEDGGVITVEWRAKHVKQA
jgi:hypothetical protein